MSKLYIFGIGGTGSRVIKSLTMLLAAGVECSVDTIVPIIIDRDEANGDFSRTKLLIDDYIKVNEIALSTDKNKFFKTKIKLLNNQLLLKLKDGPVKFEEFIGKESMSKENKALVDMLFSSETQALDMTAGFQGNPNVGSVVLNQFDNNDIFKAFATDFQDGDKIFIISSIFGGTGASGFPLLRKMLHTKNVKDADGNELPKWGVVNDAPIGAISVLPYFSVNPLNKNSLVDSDTFIDKTRAALSYYKTEDKYIDAFYYIADKRTTTYGHNKGGDAQKNNAHFVELAASMAILDFINQEKTLNKLKENDKGKRETIYKEFGVLSDSQNITFNDLTDNTRNLLIDPLSRFTLFCRYMGLLVVEKIENGEKVIKSECVLNSILKTYGKHQPYYRKINKSNNISELNKVQKSFYTWLMEMENQTRRFSPYNLYAENAFDFLRGNVNAVTEPSFFDKGFKNWARVDNELNRQVKNIDKSIQKKQLFLELFYRTTEILIDTSKS